MRSSIRRYATWSHVKAGPPDPILSITTRFQADTDPKKVNLGVGAYRDENGKPFILSCVREAERHFVSSQSDYEYAPITGVPRFVKAASKLLLGGDHPLFTSGRVAFAQSLSGTGALRIAHAFLGRFYSGPKTVYVSSPTWPPHHTIARDSGLEPKPYRYYDAATCGLDFKGFRDDMAAAPEHSIFLLHVCAHNPTGVDPSDAQWRELAGIAKQRKHFIVFDAAYQGFASGDPVRDTLPIRIFFDAGVVDMMFCQSFAKNFGMYGQRAGLFGVVTESKEQAAIVDSQLRALIRPMYSNPPRFGAELISHVLETPKLHETWLKEVKLMADRIMDMRRLLVRELVAVGSKRSWEHIQRQIGMFCYTGLQQAQTDRLEKEFHIYMTTDGRISVAGVNTKNVRYIAESIHAVTRN